MLLLHIVYFEPPVNSTIQDLHFPGLFGTLSFNFQDFPGLEDQGKNPGLSRRHGNPARNSAIVNITLSQLSH